jgi:hypothetical protein
MLPVFFHNMFPSIRPSSGGYYTHVDRYVIRPGLQPHLKLKFKQYHASDFFMNN